MPRLDFIKMDIEGAERNALRGAQDTMRRFHPKLVIATETSMTIFKQFHHQQKNGWPPIIQKPFTMRPEAVRF